MHLRSPQGERSPGVTAGVLLPNLITIASDVSDLNGLVETQKRLGSRACYVSHVISHIDSVVGSEYNEDWKLRTKQKCLTSHPEAWPKGLRFETAMPCEFVSAANDSSLLFGRVMPVLCLGLARNRWTGQGCVWGGMRLSEIFGLMIRSEYVRCASSAMAESSLG